MSRRARARSAPTAVLLATIALLGVGRPVTPVLALMTDAEVVASTLTTEILDPPTSVAATAALLLSVNLTWTATVDGRATGYQVLRATASGGPYTQVATITSPTTTAYTDTVPLPGQYYYVLRTYIASWTSGPSNEASVLAV